MRSIHVASSFTLALAALAALAAPVTAKDEPSKDAPAKDGKTDAAGDPITAPKEPKAPVTCVALARTWDDAIKAAKAQNVPIVVHHHGFYCPPCWGMHASLLCDSAYIDFAFENTVEVLALDRLQDGVDKKEDRAATYDAKFAGKPVKFLVEFPGLTVDDVLSLKSSKASSYNKSGGLPYTALIDPFTLDEVKSWKGGGIASSEIMTAITDARKTLTKAHGKGKPRAEAKILADAETAAASKLKANDFAGAIDAWMPVTKKADKDAWPKFLRDRIAKSKDAAITAATEALDAVEKSKADDAVKAKKDLLALAPRLRGTGLEVRAKEMLAAF